MKSRKRSDSTPRAGATDEASKSKNGTKHEEPKLAGKDGEQTAANEPFKPPPRPEGLREEVLRLYACLVVVLVFFAVVGQRMEMDVPKGKFQMKNGGPLIDIDEYNPSALGPYPKCHPHHLECEINGTWVKYETVSSSGPFPVGHPENPEWINTSTELMRKENLETRFTWGWIHPNLHLLCLALLCVMIGCKHGVYIFTEERTSEDAAADGGTQGGPQMLQSEDAYWFPILGSCTLFGIFLVYKYIGGDWVKFAFSCMVVFMCCGGVGTNASQFAVLVRGRAESILCSIPYIEKTITLFELIGLGIGCVMGIGFLTTKNWMINNVFGCSFCLVGMKMIGLPNYKTGAIMLVGLFFYDVFWVFGSKSVFGSNVMVTVATGVEAPIKLQFPRGTSGCGHLQHGMLGLGDIVVPGLFLCWLAKWDAYLMGEKITNSFVYLHTSLVAYVFSLVTTVAVMLMYNAAQPALLYIVPYLLIASLGCALYRGELKSMLAYDIPDGEKEEEAGAVQAAADQKKDS